MKYAVIYEKSRTGFGAYAPDLPGCVAAGATLEETAELMRGAIEMHLEAMREDGDPIPRATSVADCIEIIRPAAERPRAAVRRVSRIKKRGATREEQGRGAVSKKKRRRLVS